MKFPKIPFERFNMLERKTWELDKLANKYIRTRDEKYKRSWKRTLEEVCFMELNKIDKIKQIKMAEQHFNFSIQLKDGTSESYHIDFKNKEDVEKLSAFFEFVKIYGLEDKIQ